MPTLSEADEKLLFTGARSHNGFLPEPVAEATLRRVYDLAKMGPTAANNQPLRVVFVRTPEAKARLKPALSPGNVDKTMAAPVTAILAYDVEFYEKLPKLFPHADARSWFVGSPAEKIDRGAFQNANLQAGYFILAARGLGLDCGPMGGFDNAAVDAEFLKGSTWRSFVLMNIGYGDPAKLFPRSPRLEFDEACRFE